MTDKKQELNDLIEQLRVKYPEMSQEQLTKLARQMIYERIPKHIRESIERTNSSYAKGYNLW